jgi:tRNA modification GTPase
MKAERTIVARLTPRVPAGIASIGMKGSRAVDLVMELVTLKTESLRLNQIHYGTVKIPYVDASQAPEETVVVCRTEEDLVELHCHGGMAVSQAILRAVESAGAEVVDGEGFLDEIAQNANEASIASRLLCAKTDRVAAHLIDQLNGSFIGELGSLLRCIEKFEASQDRSERDALREKIRRLIELGERFASKWIEGWSIVLAGPPNVGKSSLMNQIVGQRKSIVHPEAGTTRDWVEAHAVIAGWPVRLSDTAGVRHASEEIEAAGVERSISQIEQADLLLLVVDSTCGWTETHARLSEFATCPVIICWNKIDLNPREPDLAAAYPIVKLSCRQEFDQAADSDRGTSKSIPAEAGVSELLNCITAELFDDAPDEGAAIPTTAEQMLALKQALTSVDDGKFSNANELIRQLLC